MSRAAQETPDAQLDSGFEDRAVAGRANPTALVVEIDFRHDEVAASVTFGPACGGPPGRAHGGVVCGVFDDVTGFAVNHFVRELAFTGELTVRYVAPVPLDTRLQISARLDRREGRKLYLTEELTADGAVLARCTATCITAAPA